MRQDAHEHAVCIRRRLAKEDPAVIGDLCVSLVGLAKALRAVGCPADALSIDEEMVKLRRGLAMVPTHPRIYVPH